MGKTEKPTDEELATALGPVKEVWDQLLAALAQEFGATVHEWKCHSPKAGWSLRVKRKDRTVVWLGPLEGSFNAAFILGDKAMRAARQNQLPPRVVKLLDDAPKYPEGTGVRLQVKTPREIGLLKKLAAIKVAN